MKDLIARDLHSLDLTIFRRFLNIKGPDLGPCYIFSTKGFCRRGLTCRFSKSHIDENGQNIKTDWSEDSQYDGEINRIHPGIFTYNYFLFNKS